MGGPHAATALGVLLLLVGAVLAGLQVLSTPPPPVVVGRAALGLMLAGLALGALGQVRRTDAAREELLRDEDLAREVHVRFGADAAAALRTLSGYVGRIDRAAALSAVHRSAGDLTKLRAELDRHLILEEP